MLAMLFTLLSACATSTLPIDSDPEVGRLRATIPYSVGGFRCESGACVIQRSSTNLFKFDVPSDTKHEVVQTCHRFDILSGVPFQYRYTPAFWLENLGSCVLFMTAIRKDGSKRLAIADFTATERAPVSVYCNGKTAKATGASICQSRVGLTQALWFDQPAEAYSSDRCSTPVSDGNGSRWEYRMTDGLCVYLFVLQDGTRHRHTTWGFTNAGVDP